MAKSLVELGLITFEEHCKLIDERIELLNCGMNFVDTKHTVIIDADMRLEPNALKEMFDLINSDEDIAVATSFLLPKKSKYLGA